MEGNIINMKRMLEFSDWELEILDEIIGDEDSRNHNEPGRMDESDAIVVAGLRTKVRDEAKRRRLWWAH